VDTGWFGRFLEDDSGWQDANSGTTYPADAAEPEFCDVHAELDGQYWYANRYSRPLISWDAPITQAPPAQQIAAPPSAGSARVVQDGSR
jgi:hypothetical protein